MIYDVLAIDIGASSGRHMLASVADGRLTLEEIHRFPNEIVKRNGHLCWDVDELFHNIVEGLKACKKLGRVPAAIGIDTWGVDYVLLDQDGKQLGDAIAYRDSRTDGMDTLLEKTLSFEALYARTGTAKQPFNTLYQLMADLRDNPAHRDAAGFLFMPCYLNYLLTGIKRNEYTIASTSAMLNAETRLWDETIIDAAGLPRHWFCEQPAPAATTLGRLRPELVRDIGFDCDVILPATHDTGSAFMAVPARDDAAAYLSSGTWSLLGVELEAPIRTLDSIRYGFTNEGCFDGKVRFLQNIMGLWILQRLRAEWNRRYTYAEMSDMAARCTDYPYSFDVMDSRFMLPESMLDAVRNALAQSGAPAPQTDEALLCSVHRSLALCYAKAIKQLEALTEKRYTSLNIIGGGSQNLTLNQWTADATGLPVYAGPGEGTALGNAIAQLIALGAIPDVQAARLMIARDFAVTCFQPR